MAKEFDESLVAAFARTPKISEIQKQTGISRSRLYRLRGDPEFQAVVRERREQLVREAIRRMEEGLGDAVRVLRQIITDESIAPQVRLNAVNTLMSQLANWKQAVEFEARLTALEDVRGQNDTI